MKNCIVSFANSRGNYVKALDRLHESLRYNMTDGDFLGFVNEASVGSPPHSKVPYAFKIHCIQKAILQGYENILYLDSSCFAVKNVQVCFDQIEADGFLFQDSGHKAATWINDFSLNYFGVTREEAREIMLVGNAGMLGLNINNGKAMQFFLRWENAMKSGCFKGEWSNVNKTESQSEECLGHRHDMVSGIILHQMELSHLAKPGIDWLQYAGVFDEVANNTIVFKAQGL